MRVIDLYLDESAARSVADHAREHAQHVVTSKTDDRAAVRIVITEGSPDELLDRLRDEVGDDPESDNFFIVSEALALVPPPEAEDQEESRAAIDEIESFVEQGAQFTKTFVILSLVSGILATAGLVKDSPAVLVGAMVLAPLFKPIASVGAGIVLGRPRAAFRAALLLAGALAMAAAAGAVVTLITPGAGATNAVVARTGVSPFDLVIALATGVAMAYALIKRDAVTMVGIVVAASLIPVASALGVAAGLWDLRLIGGAALTLAASVSGMLIGLIATCKVEELRTTDRADRRLAKRLTDRALWAGLGVVVVLIAINVWVFVAAPAPDVAPEALRRMAREDDRILTVLATDDQRLILFVDPTHPEDAELVGSVAARLNIDESRIVIIPARAP